MHRFKSILFMALFLLPLMMGAQEVPFADVRNMLGGKTAVTLVQDVWISGVVTSIPGNPNLMHNPPYPGRFTEVYVKACRKCAYIQTRDGKYGFRLEFDEIDDAARLRRYSHVTLNLKGAVLMKEGEGYVLSGLTGNNVIAVAEGRLSDIPVKKKKASDVVPEDIFTYVTLTDCEFVFKDGAFINVHETYSQSSKLNSRVSPNGMMDGWASLMYDRAGTPVYLCMNTLVPWRRDGNGVPAGCGSVSGIITDTPMPRYYGEDIEDAVQIRPLEREDIAFGTSGRWKTVCEWNWSDNRKKFHTDSKDVETLKRERVLPDVGKGGLKCYINGNVKRRRDCNSVSAVADLNNSTSGIVSYGALGISARTCDFWNWESDRGKGIVLDFSLAGVKGKNLILAFSFAAGNANPDYSYGYPVYWCVEYSLDGRNYRRIECPDIVLNTLPYWRINNINGVCYPTSQSAGLGFTEHLVRLPEELFGSEKVYIAIRPSKKRVGTMADSVKDKAALRPDMENMTCVSFGAIAVRYNK